jgi:hypothetical protein
MKDTKSYVDSLFAGYEETGGLADFKEELLSNLNDKVADMIGKGLSEEEALKKAVSELGDISALADEISLRKKQEVIGEAYMDIKRYMKPPRVAAYVIFGVFLAFGIISAFIAFFAEGHFQGPLAFSPGSPGGEKSEFTAFFGVLFAFVPLSAAGLTWLGMTQELPALYPLSNKRALWYAAGTLVLTFGLLLLPLTYFSAGVYTEERAAGALGVLIPFALPPGGLLVFLGLTEKDRRKPWAKRSEEWEARFTGSLNAARFGVFSGAIWIGAAALFILFGFIAGFRYSWVAFLFAIAVQLCVQGVMMKDGKDKEVRS